MAESGQRGPEEFLSMVTESLANKVHDRLRPSRLMIRQTQYGFDLSILVAAFAISYLLRFDFVIPPEELRRALFQLPWVVLLQFAVMLLAGVYSFIWRYVGLAEVRTFVLAFGLSCLPLMVARFGLPNEFDRWRVPLSVILMDAVLALGGVVGIRVLRRSLYEWARRRPVTPAEGGPKKPILLIGAGQAGVLAAREIRNVGGAELKVVGFVDDDPNKRGSLIQGVRVLGGTESLPGLIAKHEIDHVVISIAKASRQELRRIVDICESIPVKVRVIPGLYEILQGRVSVSRIRDLQIEDLLGREPVHLDEEAVGRFLVGKRVMVTGAGGSIGSELARQVARFQPAALLLVERAEFALFEIDRELRRAFPALSHVPLIADVSDRTRMESIFAAHRPEVVLHAAAHKHVPMMESNSTEAVKNNVLGTRMLGEISGEFGVGAFVLISTDKAVRPTSIMGASKRVAELVLQDLDRHYATRYVAVRFGNVIGSAGSVIPIFREQIIKGGPVTVTHPEMKRYFMTIPEASQLVLQAGAMGRGGEIFILDMGEPVRILDLAREAIRLSGLKPFEDIDIVFTGVRPGEKLFEELETSGEQIAKTRHPKIFIGKIAAYSEGRIRYGLGKLKSLAASADERELRRFLNEYLPEARIRVDEPIEAGRKLVGVTETQSLPPQLNGGGLAVPEVGIESSPATFGVVNG